MSHSTATGRQATAATAACLGALICWSIGPLFIEYLTGFADSWTQNTLRYSVACLFWLPYLLHLVRRRALDRRTWYRAVGPSLANIAFQSLWAAGFYYAGPAFLTLLSKTSILWIAGFSLAFFPDERPLARSGRFWASLGLSIAGLAGVLYFREGSGATSTQIGVILALLMAVMWAVYTISAKVALRQIDSRTGFSVISVYTVVGLWICAFVFGRPGQALHMGIRPWAAVVFSGITAIALGHVCFYAAIKRIGATIPMLVILAQPFVVFSLSSLIFRERLSGLQLLFGVVLLSGSALSVWAQQHVRANSLGHQPARQAKSP